MFKRYSCTLCSILGRRQLHHQLKKEKKLLIAAHGNSLRALVKYLDNISEDEIVGLNIPTGIPLVYELDDDLKLYKTLLSRRS